jgi:hypothetical protein
MASRQNNKNQTKRPMDNGGDDATIIYSHTRHLSSKYFLSSSSSSSTSRSSRLSAFEESVQSFGPVFKSISLSSSSSSSSTSTSSPLLLFEACPVFRQIHRDNAVKLLGDDETVMMERYRRVFCCSNHGTTTNRGEYEYPDAQKEKDNQKNEIIAMHMAVRHLCPNQCYLKAYAPLRQWVKLRRDLAAAFRKRLILFNTRQHTTSTTTTSTPPTTTTTTTTAVRMRRPHTKCSSTASTGSTRSKIQLLINEVTRGWTCEVRLVHAVRVVNVNETIMMNTCCGNTKESGNTTVDDDENDNGRQINNDQHEEEAATTVKTRLMSPEGKVRDVISNIYDHDGMVLM